jgi:hypothetical protein
MGDTFRELAAKHDKMLRVPKARGIDRQKVIEAFSDSFELIGGVPRLALWAHEHPGEFYKLYARLVPQKHEHSGDVRIVSAIERTVLDGTFTELPAPGDGSADDDGPQGSFSASNESAAAESADQ